MAEKEREDGGRQPNDDPPVRDRRPQDVVRNNEGVREDKRERPQTNRDRDN